MALCVPIRFETYFRTSLRGFLPDLAQQFAAYAFFARRISGHQSPRRRNNRNSHPAHNRTNPELAHVTSRAGPRDALQVRNHAPAIRGVAQEYAQRLLAL